MEGESNDDSAELKINNNNHFQSGGRRNYSKITNFLIFFLLLVHHNFLFYLSLQISSFKICRETRILSK